MTTLEKILVGTLIVLVGFVVFNGPAQAPLRGESRSVIPAGAFLNGSTTVTTSGQILFSDATNVGRYVHFSNTSSTRVWCGFSTDTSTIFHQGWFLFPSTSSTGQTDYTFEFVDGPVACISEQPVEIDWSVVNK